MKILLSQCSDTSTNLVTTITVLTTSDDITNTGLVEALVFFMCCRLLVMRFLQYDSAVIHGLCSLLLLLFMDVHL